MCLIIDNDVVQKVLVARDGAYSPVLLALHERRHCMVYGGQLLQEYETNNTVKRIIRVFDQAGLAKVVPERSIDRYIQEVKRTGLCKSNDSHVIGLARASCARVLCSEDKDLHKDFANHLLLDRPRGKVYQDSSHASLVRGRCKCKEE